MGTYAVSVVQSMAGQAVVNSLGIRVIGSTGFETPGEAIEVATGVRDGWQTNILPKLWTGLSLFSVEARGITSAIAESVAATVTAGGNPGSPSPSFAAVKVKLRTATPGRAGRGRTGLGGLTEPSTPSDQPNRLSAAEAGDFQNRFDAFRNGLAGVLPNGLELVVISRFVGTDVNGRPIPRPGGPVVSLVTSSTVDAQLGTRVSRLR